MYTFGLSSIAIIFTFQDIFKNFLAERILLIKELFRIGDSIAIERYERSLEKLIFAILKFRLPQESETYQCSSLTIALLKVFK
ncbi:MAG: mechanosensitive ion channel [Hydrococcus sp. RU_2_2]|nr:mechanosensitive ion channel [Hydrococcus sp. RU_2_2]NJP22013.1 mechanosensitive ion channel [Hydrococcus sp. CRU_1_1]